jgi:hypothetical protein
MQVRVGRVDERDWDLYIGPANERLGLPESPWACPFTMTTSREAMLAQYRVYVLEREDLVRQLPALRGLKLACWCHFETPLPKTGLATPDISCHGDVLAELVEALPPEADEW